MAKSFMDIARTLPDIPREDIEASSGSLSTAGTQKGRFFYSML